MDFLLVQLHFTTGQIKTNRKVTSIKFNIKVNKANILALDEGCATRAEKLTIEEENHVTVYIKTVQAIFRDSITEKDAKILLTDARGNVNLIKEKYDLPRKSDVSNVVGWVRDAIKGDYKAPKGKANTIGLFNDYEQRKYDFGKLEDQLLGNEEDSMSWEEKLVEYKAMKPSQETTVV